MHRRAVRTLITALALALLAPASAGAWNISDASIGEGGDLVFEVTWQPGDSLSPIEATPVGITATGGADFDAQPQTVTVGTVQVTVPTVGDDVDEADETLELRIEDDAGTGTITDDDNPPVLSIADAATEESTGAATMTLNASNPSSRDIVVPLSAVDGTATGGADYGLPATVTLPAGMRSVAFGVPVTNDFDDELDETFRVLLGAPNDASIGDGEAVVTIVNDDLRVVDVDDASTPEGDQGQSVMRFTIRLNAPTFRTVRVKYLTGDGLARAPGDYLSRMGVATFAPGQTSAVVDVPVVADNRKEAPEAFALWLTEITEARHGKAVAVGVIVDDDGGANPDTSDVMPPVMKLGKPKLRGRRLTIRVRCPSGERTCAGRITMYTVAHRRSKARALRRERRLGAKSFTLRGGASRNVTVRLSRSIVRAARRAGRLKMQAFAVTQDAGGNVDTRTRRATLRYGRRRSR